MEDLSKKILSDYVTKLDAEYGENVEFEFLRKLGEFKISLNLEQLEMFEHLEYLSKQIKRIEYKRVINFTIKYLKSKKDMTK